MSDELLELTDRCWKCSRCDWVECYSAQDLAKWGEPSECQNHYHESLYEVDAAEGLATLLDQATTAVRVADRALRDAQDHAHEIDNRYLSAVRARASRLRMELE